ncbi:MAG: rhomboid family intramembrane serine protease [Saprospiraceae bacterium]|nr:rhomboid family intramembrane serine protease [Saprospiraceae bacterium]MCB0625645.1 rhomboid family intramembrane serine protease [Saprospiraceae bacterium]MCB0677842.1 rhomboid family intramembrane serine protease [Saprospiraceae bacterium]MCB0682556.1 rhomboid family intramembrane serine protease [Saprospiraceae bacterium]
MFSSILEDIKREFNFGNMVTRIIIINGIVFVAVNVVKLVLMVTPHFETFIKFFSLSSNIFFNLTHPWVFVTNMFLHEGFLHFLFNMLFLYWFGRIVGDLLGNHRILPLYLLGGFAGALFYLLTANFIFPGASYAYGASAAVMAIVVAAGAIAPDYIMRLLFIGDVRLKYIVAALLFLDLVGIANMSNTGGHFAHLGGSLMGFLFVRQLQAGQDWSAPLNRLLGHLSQFFTQLFRKSPKRPTVSYRNPNIGKRVKGSRKSDDAAQSSHQERLDAILDKIKKSGYESLSEEEKEFLFNASKK